MNQDKKERPLNIRQKLLVVVTDIAILAELCFAMYRANLNPDEFTPIFMRSFFSLFAPTLILALLTGFMLRFKAHESENSVELAASRATEPQKP